jgi:hypothetical protein
MNLEITQGCITNQDPKHIIMISSVCVMTCRTLENWKWAIMTFKMNGNYLNWNSKGCEVMQRVMVQ